MQRRSLGETARTFHLSPEQANDRLVASLATLRELRAKRPRPHLDDKILTANNGLMISALARGHRVLESGSLLAGDDPDRASLGTGLLSAGIRAAEFVQRELFDANRGVLYRSWKQGRSDVEGFAEDYAFLIQGLLDLYEASFALRWLQWAERLQMKMDELFWDETDGGYFDSAAGDASIVLRLKEDYDGAEPAPSSVAALNLFRLGIMLNDNRATERGRRCVEAFQNQWAKTPHALPQMLCALELALEPPRHAVIAGDTGSRQFRELAAVLHERLGPRRALLAVGSDAERQWLAQRAPWLAEMKPSDGKPTVYLCEEYACRAPTSDPDELRRALA
jgi:uncharacterized protein YyaL (SSP411 family)